MLAVSGRLDRAMYGPPARSTTPRGASPAGATLPSTSRRPRQLIPTASSSGPVDAFPRSRRAGPIAACGRARDDAPPQALILLNNPLVSASCAAASPAGSPARPAARRRSAMRPTGSPSAAPPTPPERARRGRAHSWAARRAATPASLADFCQVLFTPERVHLRRLMRRGRPSSRGRHRRLCEPDATLRRPLVAAATPRRPVRVRAARARPTARRRGTGCSRRTTARAGRTRLARGRPHFPAEGPKSVIWLFMNGGPSQVDTWDYKPELADARTGRSRRASTRTPASSRSRSGR